MSQGLEVNFIALIKYSKTQIHICPMTSWGIPCANGKDYLL